MDINEHYRDWFEHRFDTENMLLITFEKLNSTQIIQ